MFRQFKSVALGVALAVIAGPTIQGQVVGQEYSSCQSDSFGFPSTQSCGPAGCGLKNGQLKQSLQQAQTRNNLIAARNDAWPKPFACLDRQAYESTWGPFIDAGYERQCVLSSIHFEQGTNELSQFGETIVANLVQNMPQARKTVFVHREADEEISQERLDNVRGTVERLFGQVQAAQVSFSNQVPVSTSGLTIERLQELQFEATPIPIIPAPPGSGGVSAAVGGG